MESVLKIAAYICLRYKDEFHSEIDEMKLHKLLYFSQREAIIQTSEAMFTEPFQAWQYGPVMVCVRKHFGESTLSELPSKPFIEKYKSSFDRVFKQYAPLDSWSLSRLTHGEISWKRARVGFAPEDQCTNNMDIEDIKLDAKNAKLRRALLSVIR